MRHRLLAILLAAVLAFGFAAVVPAQAAHVSALPQAVRGADFGDAARANSDGATVMNANAFNYLAELCRTRGEAGQDDYMMTVETQIEAGKYVELLLYYYPKTNGLAVGAATFGYGMNNYVTMITIQYSLLNPANAPFVERMYCMNGDNKSDAVGQATIKKSYKPGDAVGFQDSSFNNDYDREKCEAYNADCCTLMIDFLQNLLVEGGYSVKDLGLVDADRYYMPFTDVKPGDFYYRAVRWAVDEKITAGVSATSFAPNKISGCDVPLARGGISRTGFRQKPVRGCGSECVVRQSRPLGGRAGDHGGRKRQSLCPGCRVHALADRYIPLALCEDPRSFEHKEPVFRCADG